MNIFREVWYPENKIEVQDRNIVDILTLTERSSIQQGYFNEELRRQETRPFAINYAWKKGNCSPVLRGFQFEGELYEINSDRKTLLAQATFGSLFYDMDKIEKNKFVFEGDLKEFIAEFVKQGYQLINK